MTARLGIGTAPLGNLYSPVDDDAALATLAAAWNAGVTFADTAPLYGSGLAEERVGAALAAGAAFTISTKVGRVLVDRLPPDGAFAVPPWRGGPAFDFSADGVRRSLDSSLTRLGVDRLDAVLLHDPDIAGAMDQAVAEALPVLVRWRDEGVVGRIGAGMNTVDPLQHMVDSGMIDVILCAGRYTLLDRSGAALLDRCAESGVRVIAGGVFNSGLLAGGSTFNYEPASPELMAERDRLAELCDEHGVDLRAVAMQFVARHPAVEVVLTGARSAEEIVTNASLFSTTIPDTLWELVS
jgi:D-threo-aldose 1-dehydrogenase